MGGRNLIPFRFNPRGVVDALDGGQVPEGALSAATNLIFDSANPFTFECRPAAVKVSTFSGFSSPGFVSISRVIGDVCYGMVKSNADVGYDQPFAYNLATNLFITVTGTQTSTTLPLTQSPTGTWTPPTMDLVGVNLYVTHPGFVGGGSAFFGWFDLTNPLAPVWNSGNTAVTPLPTVPTNVKQFNNRAWFSCGSALYFTDALTTTITDPSHVLTIGDSTNITALATQPLTTAVQGIIQSLIVFKSNVIAFVTGDAVDGTLTVNTSQSGVGCSAPRTIAPTPRGVMFMAVDGIRTITSDGVIGPPQDDLKIPFINALTPSRASAAYNNSVYRITVQNGHANGNPYEEYWFDETRNGWTGPHTFVQDMVSPYNNTFVAFDHSIVPGLFVSDVNQTGTSVFTENGSDLTFLLRTSPMPDDGGLYENSAVLSVIDMQLPQVAQSYTFAAIDVNHGVLSTAIIATSMTGAVWNGFTWGNETWTATSYGMERYNIPWQSSLVFSRMVWQITGESIPDFKVGKLTVGYQPLQYVRAL